MSFFDYDGHHLRVNNPYPFLELLFKKLDLSLDRNPIDEDEDTMLNTTITMDSLW